MAYTQITLGLTLTIPTSGTRNWGNTLKNTTWTKISQHDHTGGGNGAQLGNGSFADFTIDPVKLRKNFRIYQNTSTLTPVGTTQTVDWELGSVENLTLASASGTVSLTLSNPLSGGIYKLFIIQGATPREVTWPASVKWPQGQAPILSTANGSVDIVNLYYNGTNYFGDWNLGYA